MELGEDVSDLHLFALFSEHWAALMFPTGEKKDAWFRARFCGFVHEIPSV